MATRRFGPVQGAGTSVQEKESDKPINLAPLGVTVLTGIFEKGRDFFRVGSKNELARFAGSYIPESQAPNAAIDFYTISKGAGELYIRRLKDGTEKKSLVYLKSRTFPHQDILVVYLQKVQIFYRE